MKMNLVCLAAGKFHEKVHVASCQLNDEPSWAFALGGVSRTSFPRCPSRCALSSYLHSDLPDQVTENPGSSFLVIEDTKVLGFRLLLGWECPLHPTSLVPSSCATQEESKHHKEHQVLERKQPPYPFRSLELYSIVCVGRGRYG